MKHALRLLAKSPGFTATAILTLALGIGACTAMFSIVRAVLWKPLPFSDPGRLVWIENEHGPNLSNRTSRTDTLSAWREQAKSFESIAAYDAFFDFGRSAMTGTGQPEQLRRVGVSENFLPTLGVKLHLGRNFSAEESADNGPRAAILTYGLWQRAFGGDPAVLGRTVTLNNNPTEIVGVLPRAFDFDAIFSPGVEVDVLTPHPITPTTARRGNTVFGVARLRPGVTPAHAEAELAVINRALIAQQPGRTFGALVSPLDEALRGKFDGAFLLLGGAVLCVLAIACVNLSNLLLARMNARRQEFAVRIALGARRRDLLRHTLTESLVLAFAGSILAVPLALWATDGLAQLRTFGVPLLQDAAVDPAALGVCIALTTLAGIACGMLPALQLSRDQRQMLQQASHQRTAGRATSSARNLLVIAEVALACMLLVGAGLLFRSFQSVLQVDLGFEPENATVWRLNRSRSFTSGAQVDTYFGDATRKLAALPGVRAVGISDSLPLRAGRSWSAGAKGETYTADTVPLVVPRLIDRDYLPAMRIPLRSGRYFEAQDTATSAPAVIINETFARRLWPNREAVGETLVNANREYRVVGVVSDVRTGAIEDAATANEMYLLFFQSGDWSGLELVVRSTLPMETVVREVRGALASYDPALATNEFHALESLVDNAVAARRLTTQLLGFFSTLALALAALGLYGVISYSVTQRTQEIGIRMAIGAQPRDVLALIVRGGLRLVAIGVALGLLGSVALTRLLQSQLYGIGAHDPLTFAGIAALLFAAATLACLLPALRATRVNPMAALRAD